MPGLGTMTESSTVVDLYKMILYSVEELASSQICEEWDRLGSRVSSLVHAFDARVCPPMSAVASLPHCLVISLSAKLGDGC